MCMYSHKRAYIKNFRAVLMCSPTFHINMMNTPNTYAFHTHLCTYSNMCTNTSCASTNTSCASFSFFMPLSQCVVSLFVLHTNIVCTLCGSWKRTSTSGMNMPNIYGSHIYMYDYKHENMQVHLFVLFINIFAYYIPLCHTMNETQQVCGDFDTFHMQMHWIVHMFFAPV